MGLLNPEKRWHIYIYHYISYTQSSISVLIPITSNNCVGNVIGNSLDWNIAWYRDKVDDSKFIHWIYIFSLCWQLPRDDTAQIKRKSDGFLWCIPRTVSNRTKLSSTRPLQLRHTSQLLLLLGTFLVDGRLPKLTLHGDGVGALECPQWNGWPEAQLHHASKQFRI